MRRRVDLDRRRKEHIVADGHLGAIEYHAVEIEKHLRPQGDVCPVVAEKRRLDPDVRLAPEELCQHTFSLLLLVFARGIDLQTEIAATVALLAELGLQWIV